MKNTKKILKMNWYDCLVYFWLPLNIFANLLLLVWMGQMFYPVITALFSSDITLDSENVLWVVSLVYFLLFICIIPFFYTIAVRGSLKKFKPCAPKCLSFWYVLPVLSWTILCVLLVLTLGDDPIIVSFISVIAVLLVRALIMVPNNALYFYKRAALFVKKPKKLSKRKAKKLAKKQAAQASKKQSVSKKAVAEYHDEDFDEDEEDLEE